MPAPDDARPRAYALLGRLYLGGPTPEVLPILRAVPGLAETLGGSLDADAAAADHHHVLGHSIRPYASVFLDAEGRFGGRATEHAHAFFREGGADDPRADEPPDHLGRALGFLGHLAATGRLALLRRFLDAHLLGWLPPLTCALERQPHPFYAALGALTRDLVLDHRVDLDPAPAADPLPLPPPPALLDDARAGLKDIAAYLATPAWSGLYLSRDDLAALGRATTLPTGFGPRSLLLANLLRSAATYDALPPLLDGIRAHLAAWRAYFDGLPPLPVLGPIRAAWQARLDGTDALLARLHAAGLEAPDS
ncbi:MAG: molecular chaperone TorD family protein [Rhodothermales bacterium]|nr:molecular chaperone TorD family protein [Rhodothermales bacterium]